MQAIASDDTLPYTQCTSFSMQAISSNFKQFLAMIPYHILSALHLACLHPQLNLSFPLDIFLSSAVMLHSLNQLKKVI